MDEYPHSVFAHIVTFNSAKFIVSCVESLMSQVGFHQGKNLTVGITDNASHDNTVEVVREKFPESITLNKLPSNAGFCAGHNTGAAFFLKGAFRYLLIANPDLRLAPNALQLLCRHMDEHPEYGWTCPKLLRADGSLNPIEPLTIDSSGMILCSSLRHFDRGSGEEDRGQFDKHEEIFGASGACMLLRRAFIEDMLIYDAPLDEEPAKLFPALKLAGKERKQLFDEAFFAYREDADLAWRAEGTGWKCGYVPEAVGYHVRLVLPERRKILEPELNLHSVRNRFLLQLNNYSFKMRPAAFLGGVIIRNIAVVFGVILFERTSLPALTQVFMLWKRALLIRNGNKKRRRRLRAAERRDSLIEGPEKKGG